VTLPVHVGRWWSQGRFQSFCVVFCVCFRTSRGCRSSSFLVVKVIFDHFCSFLVVFWPVSVYIPRLRFQLQSASCCRFFCFPLS
jgi:hypothetical protein